MLLPRVSLSTFLSSAKSALKTSINQVSPVTFVIGNESADLDSVCSAIVLAYLKTYAPTSQSNVLYIPLSNLPRADLSLRPELIPALSHASLKPSDLITLSDLPPPNQRASQLPSEKTRWLLVDHNILQGELGEVYGTRLIGCIDHHEEEGKVPKETGGEPRVVKKSGSCLSLVVESCKETWDTLSAKSSTKEEIVWDKELAYLALAPVLVDTSNLTDESKVTETDSEAVRYLESKITKTESDFESKIYFEELSEAKQDIGKLSLWDILRKDYKQWVEEDSTSVGISSVVKNLRFLIDKAGSKEKFLAVLREFAGDRKLSVYSIMTTSDSDGKFKRELFVWGMSEKGVKAAKTFAENSKEKLGLEKWGDGSLDSGENTQWRRGWSQEKVEHSRKQVAPLLRAAASEKK